MKLLRLHNGFSPSTTYNELQIIMIMKISKDINKIAGLILQEWADWSCRNEHLFLHLHLSKRGCFFLAPHLCQTSADWAVCLSIWRILFIFIAPHFPSLILSFNQSPFFSFAISYFIGSISAPFHTQVCPTLIIDWWVFQVAPRNLPKFISWIPDAKLVLICSKVPVWICDAKRVRFVENRRGRICDAKHL